MRYILSLLMISGLAFGIGCQNASSSSTSTKNENPADISKMEKPADRVKTETKAADHEEHNDDEAPRISLADAKKDFDEGKAIFIDTRAKTSFDNEHVKGAINVPVNDFETTYKSVPKDKKIIVYCS